MKTKDAQKKFPQHKPEPFVPEFMQLDQPDAIDAGRETHTTDEIDAILSKRRIVVDEPVKEPDLHSPTA